MNYSSFYDMSPRTGAPADSPDFSDAVENILSRMTYAELRDECGTFRMNNKRRGWRSGTFSQWLRDRAVDRVIANDEVMARDNWYGVME